MLGFRSRITDKERESGTTNEDVAKAFFDRFSSRVSTAEESVRNIASEFEKLKLSIERGQISDLVLLERIQKTERLIEESLLSIKAAIDKTPQMDENVAAVQEPAIARHEPVEETEPGKIAIPRIVTHVLSPTGEVGSLPSITTPTELQVLTLLANEGPKSAPEIGRAVGRSREHTARLMKKLFEEGYIRRDQTRIPFRYSVVDRLRQTVRMVEAKGEEKEAVSVPQD